MRQLAYVVQACLPLLFRKIAEISDLNNVK